MISNDKNNEQANKTVVMDDFALPKSANPAYFCGTA